jgi:hypothetical protein
MSESRLPIHPYAELFPQMFSPEFDRLCGDILLNGLQEEIVIHEGQILEGRHRYLACLAKHVTPRFRPYAGECGSPLAFVVSKNLHRRHLTESQRALVAARLKPLFEEEARQRQLAFLKRGDKTPVPEISRERGTRAVLAQMSRAWAELLGAAERPCGVPGEKSVRTREGHFNWSGPLARALYLRKNSEPGRYSVP